MAAIKHGQIVIASMIATLGSAFPGAREFFRSDAHFANLLQAFKDTPE